MNDEIGLSDSIAMALEEQTQRAIEFTEKEDFVNAAAILNEWTLTGGGCILTHYLQETLEEIQEELLYASIEEDGIGYGSFTFDLDAELPVDNN